MSLALKTFKISNQPRSDLRLCIFPGDIQKYRSRVSLNRTRAYHDFNVTLDNAFTSSKHRSPNLARSTWPYICQPPERNSVLNTLQIHANSASLANKLDNHSQRTTIAQLGQPPLATHATSSTSRTISHVTAGHIRSPTSLPKLFSISSKDRNPSSRIKPAQQFNAYAPIKVRNISDKTLHISIHKRIPLWIQSPIQRCRRTPRSDPHGNDTACAPQIESSFSSRG